MSLYCNHKIAIEVVCWRKFCRLIHLNQRYLDIFNFTAISIQPLKHSANTTYHKTYTVPKINHSYKQPVRLKFIIQNIMIGKKSPMRIDEVGNQIILFWYEQNIMFFDLLYAQRHRNVRYLEYGICQYEVIFLLPNNYLCCVLILDELSWKPHNWRVGIWLILVAWVIMTHTWQFW